MRDKYDDAVDFLTKNPDLIERAWNNPYRTAGGCLFQYCARLSTDQYCGCLTQVKRGICVAATQGITEAIRADPRIPDSWRKITVGVLPVFAEWQRYLDKELGRGTGKGSPGRPRKKDKMGFAEVFKAVTGYEHTEADRLLDNQHRDPLLSRAIRRSPGEQNGT